jgi:hypothetical protein
MKRREGQKKERVPIMEIQSGKWISLYTVPPLCTHLFI